MHNQNLAIWDNKSDRNIFAETMKEIFEGQEFGYFTDNNKNVWFVAKDICVILGLRNMSDAISRLDDDEKDELAITDSIGRKQMTPTINESGLYSLIATSRKAAAKRFKKHVNSQILPEIRKTGSYNSLQIQPPKLEVKELLRLAFIELEQKDVIIQEKNTKIEELKPANDFIKNTFIPMNTSIKIEQFAKISNFVDPRRKTKGFLGEQLLHELLREMEITYKSCGYILPMQTLLNRGYFEVKQKISENSNSRNLLFQTTYITTKGQVWLHKKITEYLNQFKLQEVV